MVGQKTKEKLTQESIKPTQLFIIVATILYAIYQAADIMIDIPGYMNILIMTGFVVAGVFAGGSIGSKTKVIMKIIEIITDKKLNSNEKIQRLEQLLKLICEELNLFYTEQLESFRKYLAGILEEETDALLNTEEAEKEALKQEIKRLEALNGLNGEG